MSTYFQKMKKSKLPLSQNKSATQISIRFLFFSLQH